jgi:hypothetical protein
MQLPAQRGTKGPAKTKVGKCLHCGRSGAHEPNSFAFLNAGALRKISKDTSIVAPDLEGFLAVGFHGGHGGSKRNPSAYVSIAEDTTLGQFEFYFCSIACLRKFLNGCVDELEGKLSKVAANSRSNGRGERGTRKSRPISARRSPRR